jgi:hypothetical protein
LVVSGDGMLGGGLGGGSLDQKRVVHRRDLKIRGL